MKTIGVTRNMNHNVENKCAQIEKMPVTHNIPNT
jgi:hypothetical protein